MNRHSVRLQVLNSFFDGKIKAMNLQNVEVKKKNSHGRYNTSVRYKHKCYAHTAQWLRGMPCCVRRRAKG